MNETELVTYLQEYFDELIKEGKRKDYLDCLNKLMMQMMHQL